MADAPSSLAAPSTVLNALVEEVAIIDAAGTIIQVNEAWARCTDRDGAIVGATSVGDNLLDALRASAADNRDAAEELRGLHNVLRGSLERFEHEYKVVRDDGAHWYSQRAARMQVDGGGAVIARFEITGGKRAEQEQATLRSELGRAVRAATMGQLSGALAHELNQPLTSILANAQVGAAIVRDRRAPDELAGIFEDVIDDARRAGHVIQRLRSLLQRHEVKFEVVDLNRIADDTLMLSRSELLMRNVRLEKSFASEPLPVRGDAVELQHLLINLIMNACEAMAATAPSERIVRLSTSAADTGRARLVIADSGPGIDAGARDKVFEPFYTTKKKGLGLGLSLCRSIVSIHDGKIAIGNRPTGGAEVTIELPAADARA